MAASIFRECFRRFIKLGYSPIARFPDSWPLKWSDYCAAIAPDDRLREWAQNPSAMIALCCGFGNLVAIDCDTSDQAILAAIRKTLPQCRIARFGSKGFALLARYEGEGERRFLHIYTGEGKEKRPLIEIKGMGQNITVPPSIHHKTGKPYEWLILSETSEVDVTEECPFMDELPVITDEDIARLRATLTPWSTPPRSAPERRDGFDSSKIDKSRYGKYFRTALERNAADLASKSEGRPTKLFSTSCALGAGVHHGFIPRAEFEDTLYNACVINQLAAKVGRYAILASISSGLSKSKGDELPDIGETKTRKVATDKPRLAKRIKANANGAIQVEVGVDVEVDRSSQEQTQPENDHGGPEQQQKTNGFDHDVEDTRPVIQISGGSLSCNTTEAEKILFNAKVPIYRQGGYLMRPIRSTLKDNRGDEVQVPGICVATCAAIRDAICVYARSEKWDVRSSKWIPCDPKKEIPETMISRKGEGRYWRTLAGVTNTPILRRDGSIAQQPGYDDASGMHLLDPIRLPSMPDHPTEKDAQVALGLLAELLDEFPFRDEAHPERSITQTTSYAVGMSAILTPPARSAMNVAPLHVAGANAAGTGKTYIFNIASMIINGTRCPVITVGKDDEETEKRVASRMFSGSNIICIDNVNGSLGGNLICQGISEDIVAPRILSRSEAPSITNRFIFFATGNNITLHGDLNRRSLACYMDAGVETPSERLFDHDPLAMVLADRGKYVAACLTILRAHALSHFEGAAELKPFNTFHDWSQVVRGALVWLGLRDPVESVDTLQSQDPQRMERATFISSMAALFKPGWSKPATVAEILEEARRDNRNDGLDTDRKYLMELFEYHGDKFGNPNTKRFGHWLATFRNGIFGGFRLRGEKEKKPMTEWWVEKV